MGSQDQKTLHRTFPDSASATQEIHDEKEGKTAAFFFAHRADISIAECAANGNASSIAESNGFSNTERHDNSAGDSDRRHATSRIKRNCNPGVKACGDRFNGGTL